MKKQRFNRLYTEAGERLKNDPRAIPWDEYPRPHLRRKEWLNLNGLWEFETESGYRGNIRVPFPAESPLSGFEGELRYGEKLTYKRSFTVPEGWRGKRILLHYTASRQSEAFVNGARFRGGDSAYFAVCRDITKAISEGQNELKIICSNDLDPAYPYGKQRIKRGGMWYTPCSGMWQTVWLEPVPEDFIADIRCFQDGNEQTIFVSPSMNGELVCEGKTYPLVNGECLLRFDPPRLWSPEEPNLYEFKIVAGEDEAESYFAFRTIETKTINGVPRLCLNGKPYFFNGLLDQGYFSDGLWTPAEPAEYERDIMRMKSLGFNMLRKHIKIEPELFYYYCDRLGMAVFQDMVNNGRCSFFRDTLLPTLGFTSLSDERRTKYGDLKTQDNFDASSGRTVMELRSHPSIVSWTIFNEGWGQFGADDQYEALRMLDPSRPIDATSGWFHQKKTDVFSLHVYFKKLRPFKKGGLPQAVSEFGGYVWKDAAHSFNPEKTYGYRILRSREEFVKAIRSLYLDELLPLVKRGLSAAVYTQVSDVEDETNGLLTYDRRVMKLSPEEFLDAAGEIKKAAQAE